MKEFDLLGNVQRCLDVLQGQSLGYWDSKRTEFATYDDVIHEAIIDLRLYQRKLQDNKKVITGVKFGDSTSND